MINDNFENSIKIEWNDFSFDKYEEYIKLEISW